MTIMRFVEGLAKPRFHGNGMIQIYVTPTIRLHVWSPDLPAFDNHNALIHDHVFHMKSTVLAGRLRHRLFSLQPSERPTDRIIQFVPDTRKSAKGVTAETGVLSCDHLADISADCEYHQCARTFHSSEPVTDWGVATVMFKLPDDQPDMARIICPIDEEPTDAFDPRQSPSESEMYEALNRFFYQNNVPVGYLQEVLEGYGYVAG